MIRTFDVKARVKPSMAGPGYDGHVEVNAEGYDQAEEIARREIYNNFKDRMHGPYNKDIVIESISLVGDD